MRTSHKVGRKADEVLGLIRLVSFPKGSGVLLLPGEWQAFGIFYQLCWVGLRI